MNTPLKDLLLGGFSVQSLSLFLDDAPGVMDNFVVNPYPRMRFVSAGSSPSIRA